MGRLTKNIVSAIVLFMAGWCVVTFANLPRDVVFASLSVVVAMVRYATYLWSIYQRETRPHAFSYFLWALLTGIGAAAQFVLNGGLSAWVLTLVSSVCFLIAVLALFVGHKKITRSDWLALIAALMIIPVWKFSNNPVLAICCLIVIDFLSYWPTIRKSWADPWGEPPHSYFWAGLRYFYALFAVGDPTVANLAYPLWLMASDWGFMFYNFWRRRALQTKHSGD